MNELKETILQKIQEGKVHMQPRWHFVLKTTLFVVGTVVMALASLYLLSFIFFTMRRSGLLFAPELGLQGIVFFITSSPWVLIGLVMVFLSVLYILVKHYAFSYRRPLVYSILAVALFAIGGASALHAMGVHERIELLSQRYEVPGIAPMYHMMIDERPQGVTLGVITEHTEQGFMLNTEDEETLHVLVDERTKLPRRIDRYDVDDVVFVFGDRDGESITAFGVRPVSDEPEFQRPGMRGQGGMRGKQMMYPPNVAPFDRP